MNKDERADILRKVARRLRQLRRTGDMVVLKRVGDRVVVGYHPEHDSATVVLKDKDGGAA